MPRGPQCTDRCSTFVHVGHGFDVAECITDEELSVLGLAEGSPSDTAPSDPPTEPANRTVVAESAGA